MRRVDPHKGAATAFVCCAVFGFVSCQPAKKTTPAPSITALSPDTHGDFPILDGAHGGVDCNACHGEFETFRSFDCLNGCHAAPATTANHQGVDGFAYESSQCLACHPAGTATGGVANHPFPIDPFAVHNGFVCGECHTKPADKTVFTCTSSCHEQSATTALHHGIADFRYDSPSCLSCHPQGVADATIDHSMFPIGAGTKHPLGCSQCHQDASKRQDLSTLACVSCHATKGVDAKHAKVADYTPSATASPSTCLACHAESQVMKVASHTMFPIAFGRINHDTLCLGCHDAKRADKPYAADFKVPNCITCHTMHPNTTQAALGSSHATVAGYAYATPQCLSCHPQGMVAPPANHGQYFPIDAASKHTGIGCTECHSNLAQPKNAANFRCGTCHQMLDAALVTKHTTNTSKPSIKVKASEISVTSSATCLRCHADAQVDKTSAHPTRRPCTDAGSPPHHSAGCLDCHSGMRSDKTYAAIFTGTTPPGCAQCHENGQVCP